MITNYVKTPSYTQIEMIECGAVCLQIILAYHDCFCTIEELRELCGVSRDGSNAESLINAAQYYGLEGEGFFADLPNEKSLETNLSSLCDVSFPYIAFWEFNHFVVIEGVKKNKVLVNDPALGRYAMEYHEFSQHFTGIVLAFKKTTKFKTQNKYPKPWIDLWHWVWAYPKLVVMILIIDAVTILPLLIAPSLLQINIDYVLIKDYRDIIHPLIISLISVYSVKIGLTYFQTYLVNKLRVRLTLDRQKKIISHLMRLPMLYFDRRLPGDILFQLNGVERISDFLSSQTISAFISLLTFIFYFCAMAFISPSLATIIFCLTVVQLGFIIFNSRYLTQHSRSIIKHQGLFFAKLVNGISLIDTLKSESQESILYQQLDSQHDKVLSLWKKLNQKMVFLNTLPSTLDFLSKVLILFLGAWYILKYNFSLGELVAFITLSSYFQAPIAQIVSALTHLKAVEADVTRLNDIANYEPRNQSNLDSKDPKKIKGKNLSVNNLYFGFNRFANPTINNISFKLNKGEKLAIVGSLGSGKSTLIKCITGLYAPWKGSVTIDGHLIGDFQNHKKNNLIGVVSQNIYLFEGTVRENLNLWNDTFSDEELIDACRQSFIYDDLIDRGGLDAHINIGGDNLSGGQKQRLELARILVKNPSFIILDEGTSALDFITEEKIIQNIAYLDIGLIVIAHRLKSIQNSHIILVLENGMIIEQGTHQELMELQKVYYNLFQKEGNDEFDAH